MQEGMSALPPKADMCGATKDVRYGPQADISFLWKDVAAQHDEHMSSATTRG